MQRLGDPEGGFCRVPMLDESDGQKVSLWTLEGKTLLHTPPSVKVARGARNDLLTFRATGTGQLVTYPCYLYWLTYCPNNVNNAIQLADSLVPALPIAWCVSSAIGHGQQFNLDPPMPFWTGIYLVTFTAMDAITIGFATT